MRELRELLHGAIDMHVHANPDLSLAHPQHRSNRDVIDQCHAAGMGGLVLKSHGFANIGLAQELSGIYDDFTVFPSLALNVTSGGPRPWVVDMAIGLGVKLIWLPTWSAQNDRETGKQGAGIGAIAAKYLPMAKAGMRDEDYYYLLDEQGELKADIKECIKLCRDADIVLATGHISAKESYAVGKFAHSLGYHKLCLTHPSSRCSRNDREEIKAFAQLGHCVEFCALNVAPLHTSATVKDIKRIIEDVGPEHCYISTDHFFDWSPDIPQQIYQLLGCLSELGTEYEELEALMETPRRLLGV